MSTSEPTMSIQRFSRKNGGKAKAGALDRLGRDRCCGHGFPLAYPKHAGQESQFNLTFLADALDLMQHRRAQKVGLTCNDDLIRADPVYQGTGSDAIGSAASHHAW